MEAVYRHEEAVRFCAGLMSYPTPLVKHLSELYLNKMRSIHRLSVNSDLYQSLYTESKIQLPGDALHNPWINWYEGFDKTPLFIPSRFYGFEEMKVEVVCNNEHGREEQTEKPECAIYICWPDAAVAASILCACQTICQRQNITDLWIKGLKCDDTTLADVFCMSSNA